MVNTRRPATLATDWITADSLLKSTGVCLSFLYMISDKSSLQVIVKTTPDDNGTLMWNLTGYQGNIWTKGQVSWKVTTLNKFMVSLLKPIIQQLY